MSGIDTTFEPLSNRLDSGLALEDNASELNSSLFSNSSETAINSSDLALDFFPEESVISSETSEFDPFDSLATDKNLPDELTGAIEPGALASDFSFGFTGGDFQFDSYQGIIINSGILEDNFDNYDFSLADGSDITFTGEDFEFSEAAFNESESDENLVFELYDGEDVVFVETDISPIDLSFIENPTSFKFDNDFYLASYPEVSDLGIDPLVHYMNSGWKEGKDPSRFFDTSFYLETYNDVRIDGINPLTHYNSSGWKELRDPTPFFDTSHYLESNPDVLEADMNPLFHFQSSGWIEGRDPNQFFDTDFYLASNSDVRFSGYNPLDHYISSGEDEGRLPSLFFDGDYYLNKYPEVAEAGYNSLEHFLRTGKGEGRSSNLVLESPDRVLVASTALQEGGLGIPVFNPIKYTPAWFLIGGTIKLIDGFVNGGYELQVDSVQSFTFSDVETGTPPISEEPAGTIQVEVFPGGGVDDLLENNIFRFPVDEDFEGFSILRNPGGGQAFEDLIGGDVLTFPDEVPTGTYYLSIETGSPEWRTITNTTDRFIERECSDCARQLQDLLQERGVSGKRVRLENGRGRGRMFSDSLNKLVSNNGYHEGVVVEVNGVETVFDNFYTTGIPLEEWKTDIFADPPAEFIELDSW